MSFAPRDALDEHIFTGRLDSTHIFSQAGLMTNFGRCWPISWTSRSSCADCSPAKFEPTSPDSFAWQVKRYGQRGPEEGECESGPKSNTAPTPQVVYSSVRREGHDPKARTDRHGDFQR